MEGIIDTLGTVDGEVEMLGTLEGLIEILGVCEGKSEGNCDGALLFVGIPDGCCETVGLSVMPGKKTPLSMSILSPFIHSVGTSEGVSLGISEGIIDTLGSMDIEGLKEGSAETEGAKLMEGENDGLLEGNLEGAIDKLGVSDGVLDDISEGWKLSVGNNVDSPDKSSSSSVGNSEASSSVIITVSEGVRLAKRSARERSESVTSVSSMIS